MANHGPSGAHGIQIPHISGKEDAVKGVKAVRYAPLGERGMGGATRAARYGAVPMEQHKATSNEEILLIVMVEDMVAVEQIEEIASVDGIDLIAIGPTDLAQSLGIEITNPRYSNTLENISEKIREIGKARMAFPLNLPAYPLGVSELKRLGVAYANCGPADVSRLLESYRLQVREVHDQLSIS